MAPRVVIAEDGSLIRLDLKETLEEEGYEVVAELARGDEAAESVRRHEADLAILDIKMPGMDGLQAAREIAGERRAAVLILTAFSQRDLIEQARDAGAMAYLVKPFERNELLEAVEVALGRFNEMRALAEQTTNLEEQLETRRLVDRAKGRLMDEHGFGENAAFSFIQKRAMADRVTMRSVAASILDGSLRPAGPPAGDTHLAAVPVDEPGQESHGGHDAGAVYLDTQDPALATEFEAALIAVLGAFGLDLSPAGDVEWGSWMRRFMLKALDVAGHEEVASRLQKVEHAVELRPLHQPMSVVNVNHAEAIARLAAAAERIDNFAVVAGSLLYVKATQPDGKVDTFARTLSVSEVREFEKNRAFLTDPHAIIEYLRSRDSRPYLATGEDSTG